MSIERKLDSSAPMKITWCDSTDPPCPFKGENCGIKKRLREYHQRLKRREEAERLLVLSQKDPERLHRICQNSLFDKNLATS